MASSRLSPDDLDGLQDCQQRLGYCFKSPQLLCAALTHTSGANTRLASNERMEFLGDSVLGLVTCELLYERFPQYDEGDLTKIKSVVVSRKTCAEFSEDLNIDDFLILGKGMTGNAEVPMNVLADTFEALAAAVFLDGGWDEARAFIRHFIEPTIENVATQALSSNAKAELQQIAQKTYGGSPRYCLVDEQGPDHDKCFKIVVDIEGHRFEPAWGRNKKIAELNAALNALATLQARPLPFPS